MTDIYGIMWKPADFDSTKCYPIISTVYPGPFYEYVQTRFTLDDDLNTRLAQVGFIVELRSLLCHWLSGFPEYTSR